MSETRPDAGKLELKKLFSSLGDDPFINEGGVPETQASNTSIDSIFSFGPPPVKRRTQPLTTAANEVKKPPVCVPESASGRPPESSPRIKDAVLTSLIQEGTLSAEMLSMLFPKLNDLPPNTPPWRLALAIPGISPEKILDTVARIYQIPTVDLAAISAIMLQNTWVSLPLNFKKQCETLWVLPFAYELHDRDKLMLKLACCDPIRHEVISFLRGLKTEIRLFYARPTQLSQVFQQLTCE